MIKNFIARFGFGSATVDLQTDRYTYKQGELIEGQIIIKGGETKQKIDNIYVYLVSRKDDVVEQVERIDINKSFDINPSDELVIPFAFRISEDVQPSVSNELGYYFKTGLNIDDAIDPVDFDYINIEAKNYVHFEPSVLQPKEK